MVNTWERLSQRLKLDSFFYFFKQINLNLISHIANIVNEAFMH